MSAPLELLLDTMLESYQYRDADEHETAKELVLEEAREHIHCPSRSMNSYAILAHELYAVYAQRREQHLLEAAVLVYAMGMVRHNEFGKLRKQLPKDIDPALPGVKRLSEPKALLASLYFEREGRFDLASKLWERRGDYELAKAYRTIKDLRSLVDQRLPVQ